MRGEEGQFWLKISSSPPFSVYTHSESILEILRHTHIPFLFSQEFFFHRRQHIFAYERVRAREIYYTQKLSLYFQTEISYLKIQGKFLRIRNLFCPIFFMVWHIFWSLIARKIPIHLWSNHSFSAGPAVVLTRPIKMDLSFYFPRDLIIIIKSIFSHWSMKLVPLTPY